MNEMIEKVARALCKADSPSADVDAVWWCWANPARAAIAAMREPTEVMRAAASDLDGPTQFDAGSPSSEVWRAMIGAALKD